MRFRLTFLLVLLFVQCIACDNESANSKYRAITELLNKYERPITVLEMGMRSGYYSFSIAQDYDATCVMIDPSSKLLRKCKQSNLDTTIVLKQYLELDELKRLAECEHFDVIIISNIDWWCDRDWQKAFSYFLRLGDYLYIDIPSVDYIGDSEDPIDMKLIHKYLQENGAHSIGRIPYDSSSTVATCYFLEHHKEYLKRAHWTRKHTRKYRIKSTFKAKSLFKKNKETEWHKGINLLTFKMLNGVYPSLDKIKNKLDKFKKIKHSDIRIFNMIIQGETIVPIDFTFGNRPPENPKVKISLIQKILEMDPEDIYSVTRDRERKSKKITNEALRKVYCNLYNKKGLNFFDDAALILDR